jgi:hypothetical protein
MTTRHCRVFALHAATGRQQLLFGELEVRDAKLEDRPIRRPFVNVETE